MSMHTEWVSAARLDVYRTDSANLPDGEGEGEVLVMEDGGNCLRFVVTGSARELRYLTARLLAVIPPDDSPDSHIVLLPGVNDEDED